MARRSRVLELVIDGNSRGATNAIDRVDSRTSRFSKTLGAATKAAGLFVLALGAAAVGASVLAVKHYAEAGEQVHKMSLRTGFAAETLSELNHAAQLSGTSLDQFDGIVKKMARSIYDADRGLKETQDAFSDIGVNIKDLEALSPEDKFLKIASALADVEDHTKKVALAQILFGRQGVALLPMLERGAAGLAEMRQEARDLGIVMSQEDAEAAAEFNDNMTRLNARITSVKFAIARALIPVLIDLQEWLGPRLSMAALWLADLWDNRLQPALSKIGSMLDRVVLPRLRELRGIVMDIVVQPIIDMATALGLLEGGDDADMHPVLKWVTDNKDLLKVLGAIVAGVLGAIAAFKLIVGAIAGTTAVVVAVKAAWAGLLVVWAAISIPVLLVAAAIGIVIAAIVLLIASGWDVEEALGKIGSALDVVGVALGKLGDKVGELVTWVTEQLTDTENWEALGEGLIAAWGAAVDFVGWAASGMARLGTWLVEQVTNTENWQKLGSALITAWGHVVDFVGWAASGMVKLGAWLVEQVTNTENWKKLGSALIGAFGPLLDFVVWAVKGMDALVAWVIAEAFKLDNWKALGKALVMAFAAPFVFVALVAAAFAKLVTWVVEQALDTENWRKLGSALITAFAAALKFWQVATDAWEDLKTWIGETIVKIVSESKTWAALGEAVKNAVGGGMDFLGAIKGKWQSMINGVPALISSLRTAIADLWSDMIPDIPLPSVGGVAKAAGGVASAAAGWIPGMKDGGIVPATPGGRVVRVGEGSRPEVIAPLPAGGFGDTYYITIEAGLGDPDAIMDRLLPVLQSGKRRGTLVGVTAGD